MYKKGTNHHNWKGGKPKCFDCGKELRWGRTKCQKHMWYSEDKKKSMSEKKCIECKRIFHKKKESFSTFLKKSFCTQNCSNLYFGKIHIGIKRPKMIINTKSIEALKNWSKTHRPWNFGKGTISSQSELARKCLENRLWRKAIFERDNFSCRECGKIGGELHAHHVKPFAYFTELRYAIDNGITLCHNCHKLTDSYGGGKNI